MSLGKLKRRLYLVMSMYFKWWASLSLRRWRPRVIAVTGSVGKTTMLHLLQVQFGKRAHYSHHANSIYGIAFDIVGLRGITGSKLRWLWLAVAVPFRALTTRHREEFYIVEIDADRPHEARVIAEWLRPEVSLWISVGHSHAHNFETMVRNGQFATVEEAIAHEFAAVARATSKLAVIDASSDAMQRLTEQCTAEVVAVAPTLVDYHVEPTHTVFQTAAHRYELPYPLQRDVAVQLAMLEAACHYLTLSIVDDWSSFTIAPGRNSYFAGKHDTHIIDSSYNAHLLSMRSMIQLFDELDVDKKWLVIGDMIEQGRDEAREHKLLGEALAAVQADRYVLVGRRVSAHTWPVLEAHDLADKSVRFDDAKDALTYIETHLSGGETLLFKGSQYLEWIVEKLLADPSDTMRLVRQEPAAKLRRQKRGLT